MRKLSLVIVLLFLGTVFTRHRSEAVAGLSVSEDAIALRVSGDGFLVELPFLNAFEKPLAVNARVELVEPDDRVIGHAETRSEPIAGRAVISVPLKVSFPESGSNREFLQGMRLRFYLDSGTAAPPVEGVVALSRIAHDFFELTVAAPEAVRPGQRVEIRVRARNPFSNLPIAGVTVVGKVARDETPFPGTVLEASVTDAQGQTSCFVRIPDELKERELTFSIVGSLGVLRETARMDVPVFPLFQPRLLSSDKPLYQPGQTAKLRLMAFGENRRALAKGTFRISIRNDKKEVQFSTTVKTSRFGIVGCEWAIPENQPLGSYHAVAAREGDESDWNEVGIRFEIRRFELPTFSVTVQPDQPYYLIENTPVVTIRGEFLQGAPVVGGSVRVVRFGRGAGEDTSELGVGVTDEKGVCRVTLDADRVRGLFPKEEAFRDEHLAAFLTDPATGREEIRRFDLRLTRDGIHLYSESDFTVFTGLPLKIPVLAERADGTPLECDVELFAIPTGTGIFTGKIGDSRVVPLGKIRTSRFGFAIIDRIAIPELDSEKRFGLLLRANAGTMRGSYRTNVTVSDEPALSITTDALLYPAARPVTVNITANDAIAPDDLVTVQLVTETGVVASKAIRLASRRASFSFQETAALRGPVTIFATLPFAEAIKEVVASRVVLFPEERKVLNAVATTERDGYRPGDRASLALSLADERGRPVVGAFGVVVGDRAVGENYRRETGRPFSPFGNAAREGFFPPRVEFAGVTLEDLRALDPARPLPPDLEPVAEWILRRVGPFASIQTSDENSPDAAMDRASFLESFEREAMPFRRALDEAYEKSGRTEFPDTSDSLRSVFERAGLRIEDLRDPWGQPYRLVFEYDFYSCVAFAESAGRDEGFDTADDVRFRLVSRSFFLPVAKKLDQAAKAYRERAGEPIPDAATLFEELKRIGVEFEKLKDPWGRPYFVKVVGQFGETVLSVRSYGPTGHEETPYWNLSRPFFRSEAATIRRTLRSAFQKNGRFPTRMSELREILAVEGVDPEIFSNDRALNVNARFSSSERRAERAITGKKSSRNAPVLIQPLVQTVLRIELFSEGYDRKPDTPDDFTLDTIHLVVAERPVGPPAPKPSLKLLPAPVEAGKGGIAGKVTDQTGAVIVAVKATARQVATGREFKTETDEYGVYRFTGLPSGTYHLSFSKHGFRTETLHDFEVPERMNIEADVSLIVGFESSDIVEINSSPGTLVVNSSNASVTTVVRELPVNGRNFSQFVQFQKGAEEIGSTPRVREYFPETLVWQPEIVTDARGRAKLPFTLADTVTTWRVGVIASTEDGQVALAERDITAALPFFVDVDPPRTLTQGDEVAWPIVVRNELSEVRNVAVRLAPTKGFEVIEGGARSVSVAAGGSGAVTIPVRAVAPVIDGKPRVTVRAGRDADAVEKPITVRPDGMERTSETGGFSSERFGLDSVIPANALPNSARMTLKIYPEFASHVFEGITGILQRPHGCGEQTISSTYPNVLVLQYLKRSETPDAPTRATALRYAAEGYERLRKYQEPDGGFSYWGDGNPDEALTAYALAFLADLAEFVPVDRTLTARAAAWLAQRQATHGSWSEDPTRTAWITKSLISASVPESGEVVRRALAYFALKADSMDDPYVLAAFGTAARATGQVDLADRAAARLRQLAKTTNGGTVFWEARGETPFHGWGRAGEIETTALAVQALAGTGVDDQFVTKAIRFLLANKDRYGVWHSSQATVLVQKTLMSEILRTEEGGSRSISVTVDGRPIRTIPLPAGRRQEFPIQLDLSAFALPGSHRIEIVQSGDRRFLSAQVVASWYVPWTDVPTPSKDAPQLAVTFDRTECRVGDEIRCDVEVRMGKGAGMTTVEVGLPPGAEVDRASLMGAAIPSRFRQFEIRPDRIVFYLNEGEPVARRAFVFRPRFCMKAKNIGSTVYDYYNPDARTTVAPVTFVVGARASSAQ